MWYAAAGLVLTLAILAIWWVSTGNRFRRLGVKINESESGIDVALARRYSMLTKMVDVCRQYASFEQGTLYKVVELRGGMTMAQRGEADRKMDALAGQLDILVEAYPQLRASEQYKELQRGIRDAEEHLQAARRLYNSNVSVYNQLLASFPSSLVGGSLNMAPREFFEAEEKKRQDADMNRLAL